MQNNFTDVYNLQFSANVSYNGFTELRAHFSKSVMSFGQDNWTINTTYSI